MYVIGVLEIEEKRNAQEAQKLTITLSAGSEETSWSELTAATAVLNGEEGEEPREDKKQELEPEALANPKGNESVRQWLWWLILVLARDFTAAHCVGVTMAAEDEPITRFTVPNIWPVASSSSSSDFELIAEIDQRKWLTKLISKNLRTQRRSLI